MGPFKHTVDDGLDLRKAAFECMYTLLDSCLDRLDVFEFLNHVELGLKGKQQTVFAFAIAIPFNQFCEMPRSLRHQDVDVLDGRPIGQPVPHGRSSAA